MLKFDLTITDLIDELQLRDSSSIDFVVRLTTLYVMLSHGMNERAKKVLFENFKMLIKHHCILDLVDKELCCITSYNQQIINYMLDNFFEDMKTIQHNYHNNND